MSFSNTDEQYEKKFLAMVKDMVLRIVASYNCAVFLFGSRAEGKYSRSSDYDIGIEGLDKESFEEAEWMIKALMDGSPIPHNIDVVNFDTVDEDFKKIAKRSVVVWKEMQNKNS